jgi:uncharacterized protein YodC (DUF2158 family)
MSQFKVGNVVQLKSGGPTMTVRETKEKVDCQWFDDKGELKQRAFDEGVLKKISE